MMRSHRALFAAGGVFIAIEVLVAVGLYTSGYANVPPLLVSTNFAERMTKRMHSDSTSGGGGVPVTFVPFTSPEGATSTRSLTRPAYDPPHASSFGISELITSWMVLRVSASGNALPVFARPGLRKAAQHGMS